MMPSRHDRKRSKRARQKYVHSYPGQGSDMNEKNFDENSRNFEESDSKSENLNNSDSSYKNQTENIKGKLKETARKARKVILKHKKLACCIAGIGGVLLCLPALKGIINHISESKDRKMF